VRERPRREEPEAPPAAAPEHAPEAPAVGELGDARMLGAQRQALARSIGARYGNRHLAAAVAELRVARQPAAPPTPVEKLRTLLDDDDEEDAITLMGTLAPPDVATVLASADYQRLAVSAFDNDEMYRGVKAMKGDLKRSLEWMFDEGTDYAKVKDVVVAATAGHAAVRTSMRAQFVDLCDNREMAEIVDLLKGDLAFKLDWMREEGTSWALVRPKLIAAPEPEKAAIRASTTWRDFFVDICNNDEMGLAVQLLGGDLEFKLGWIQEEGANWQRLVQVIAGCTNDAEKAPIRNSVKWRDFFVGEVNNEQMAQVVDGLGGDLTWRLGWMREEGTSWTLVARQLRMAPEPDKAAVRGSEDMKRFFVDLCGNREMSEAVDLLGGDLTFKLTWMAAEGADWPQLREKIALAPEAERAAVRGSEAMKQFFVETCGNEQMADAVTILGGDLAFRLGWMRAEGADWPRVKAFIDAAPEAERAPLRNDSWKPFFVDVCSNREMAQAVAALGGDLSMKLAWMEEEGTDWGLVKPELIACTDEAQKAAVRGSTARRDFFVSICGNAEMAEAVDLLGGDLAFKLDWMKEEGTSWELVREKIVVADEAQRKAVLADPARMKWLEDDVCSTGELMAAKAMLGGGGTTVTLTAEAATAMDWPALKTQLLMLHDDAKKAEIRGGGPWLEAFTSVCGNDEMSEAVDLLGGDLAFKLSWMKDEGTDWQHVKEKLRATADDAQKAPIRASADWRAFFVDVCGNEEMAEAVALLGGDLKFKLDWMLEEGTDGDLLLPIVNAAPAADKTAVAADAALAQRLSAAGGTTVMEALGSPSFIAGSLIDKGGADTYVQALRVIATAPTPATVVTDLQGNGRFARLLDNCPVGTALPVAAKQHVDVIYKSGPPTVAERKKLIHVRYRIEISDAGIAGKAAVAWGQTELDMVYETLAQLPEGSVLSNDDIQKLHHVVSGIGTYYSRYSAIHLPGGGGYNASTSTWPNAVFVENHFRGSVRHEMGHAIDEMISAEDWYMSDPNIDWDVWGDVDPWLSAMEELGGWGPVAGDADRDQIRAVLRAHFADPSVSVAIAPPADPNNAFNKFPACPIVATATLNGGAGSFNNFAAMPPIGGRVFTRRDDYGQFYSYAASARNPPVWVSNYGLSAPSDWFAEQVREYFRTTPPGANTAPFVANYLRMALP
jgi:hypothetical protein